MYDVIVVGAGPAGIMASITASYRGKKVLLIEKNNIIGKKLSITGGGRCNLTNNKNINDFINNIHVNPKALFSTLSKFGPCEIMRYFEKLNVKLKIEEEDKVFPVSNNSRDIIEALKDELKRSKVDIALNTRVIEIKNENKKVVVTNNKEYTAESVVIATGGMSFSKTGSTGDGYMFAKKLKQPLIKTYPVETPLRTKYNYQLAGVRIDDSIVTYNNNSFSGPILFTHNGLTGPAILKISEFVYLGLEKNNEIVIDLSPSKSATELLEILNNINSKKEIKSFVREFLPNSFSDFLLKQINIESSIKVASVSKKDRIKLIDSIKKFKIEIMSAGNIEEAIVTGGGVDLKYIDTKNMQSKITTGIFFAGEILDLHGPIGGYNITIALSTGFLVGNYV